MKQSTDSAKPGYYPALDRSGPTWISGSDNTKASSSLQTDLLANLASLQDQPAGKWNGQTLTGTNTHTIQLDGTWQLVRHTYDGYPSIIDPHHEWNVHDQLFTQSGNAPPGQASVQAKLNVTDSAGFMKTSGAYGVLGAIKFQQAVSGSAWFWAPN